MIGLVLAAGRSAIAEDWTHFRGPTGAGMIAAHSAPLTWSETENIAWKTPLTGRAWSSPVVEGDWIWLTNSVETPYTDSAVAEELGGNRGGQKGLAVARVELSAIGLHRDTGEVVHEVPLFVVDKPQPIHALNSFASPTPVIEDGRLYCNFGAFGAACIDTRDGRVLWSNQDVRIDHETGPGSSPVVYGDVVIVHADGIDEQYLIAWNKWTGEVAWRTERSGELPESPSMKKSFATPQIATIDGRDVLLSPATDWLYAYDPATGEELWKVSYEHTGFSVVSQPVVADGVAYFSTAFMQANVLAVRFAEAGRGVTPEILWRYTKQAPNMPSVVLAGDELYFVSDRGIATCVDAKTGEAHWVERLTGEFSASPLFAAGRVYFFGRTATTVVAASPEFEVLAENKLDGEIMSTPALIDGVMFLRTDQALYRIEAAGQ